MKDQIELKEIDKENWKFTLYESPTKQWIVDIVYNPISFVTLSMLIALTEGEKDMAMNDRNFLIELSERVRHRHNDYSSRALSRKHFIFPRNQDK